MTPGGHGFIKKKSASRGSTLVSMLCRGVAGLSARGHRGCRLVGEKVASVGRVFRYDPFGKQRDVSLDLNTPVLALTTQSYTGHEKIEGRDIIHMGGRIYDAVIGRMLQADILVQAPTNILSYNRYAYVINNPVNLIDPTGYAWEMSSPYNYSNPDNGGCGSCGGDGPTDDNLNGPDSITGGDVDPQKRRGFWGGLWDGFKNFLNEPVVDDSKARAHVHMAIEHAQESLARYEAGEISKEQLDYEMAKAKGVYETFANLPTTRGDFAGLAFDVAVSVSPFAAAKLGKVPGASIDDIIDSGLRPARPGSQDSRALQALKKKVDRGDDAFSGLPKTQEAADDVIRDTLNAKKPVVRTKDRNGQKIRDVYDPGSGRGVRTIDDKFDTFVNF